MTRLLLALVALLTGLAVQSAPAGARICAASAEIGVMQADAAERGVASRSLPGGLPLSRQIRATREPACAVAKTRPVYIPSIQLGIDLALE